MQTPTESTTADRTATVSQKFCVSGMTCQHCEMAVTSALMELDAVVGVTVDVATGTVITECTAPLEMADVAAAVDLAGYGLV